MQKDLSISYMHIESGRKCDSYLSHRLWVMFSICIFYIAEKKVFKRILRKHNRMLVINHQEVERDSLSSAAHSHVDVQHLTGLES